MKFAIINAETHAIVDHAANYREACRKVDAYMIATGQNHYTVGC